MAKVLGMNQPTQPKIDITKSKALECTNCGDTTFIPAMQFRKMSKLLAGTQKDAIIPIEVYMCAGCGEINVELLPDELKNLT
jgi:DNA-directed RNA polymerase subunit RPC12/RpoP